MFPPFYGFLSPNPDPMCDASVKPAADRIFAGQRRPAASPRLPATPSELPLRTGVPTKQMGHSQFSLSSQCASSACDSFDFVDFGLRRKPSHAAGVGT